MDEESLLVDVIIEISTLLHESPDGLDKAKAILTILGGPRQYVPEESAQLDPRLEPATYEVAQAGDFDYDPVGTATLLRAQTLAAARLDLIELLERLRLDLPYLEVLGNMILMLSDVSRLDVEMVGINLTAYGGPQPSNRSPLGTFSFLQSLSEVRNGDGDWRNNEPIHISYPTKQITESMITGLEEEFVWQLWQAPNRDSRQKLLSLYSRIGQMLKEN